MKTEKSMIRLLIVALAIIPAMIAGAVDVITPIQAAKLVEWKMDDLQPRVDWLTQNVTLKKSPSEPVYHVAGHVELDGYMAVVDAMRARVMSIEKNGTPFYRWEGVKIVGHRGTVKFAPENTVPAFREAIKRGADLLEIDIRETQDGHLVIIHDSTVNRTTNGSGRVSDLTLAEIQAFDAGSWFAPKYTGVNVPTLREGLEFMRGKAFPDLDFKAGTPKKLVALLREFDLLGKVTLHCGDRNLLKAIQQLTDGLSLRPTLKMGFVGLGDVISVFDAPIVNVDWREFDDRLVREIHLAGRKSFLNTLQHDNEFGIRAMIETAPDYVQSDNIEMVLPILRAKGWHD